MSENSHTFSRIYAIVRQVPPGRVVSYGEVARIVGCTPREVGYAMAGVKSDDIPWQRVINAQGKISLPDTSGARQRQLLEEEGVTFDQRGRVDFKKYGWLTAQPDDNQPALF